MANFSYNQTFALAGSHIICTVANATVNKFLLFINAVQFSVLYGIPDSANQIKFIISDLIRAFFNNYQFILPSATSEEAIEYHQAICSFEVRPQDATHIESNIAIDGWCGDFGQLWFNDSLLRFGMFWWLTNLPSKRYTTRNSKQYLACYVDVNNNYVIKFIITYTDGTTSTFNKNIMQSTTCHIYSIPCGYVQIAAHLTAGKEVFKYNVQVLGRTSVYEFYMKSSSFNQLDFLFKNRYGLPEILITDGSINEKKLELKIDIYEIVTTYLSLNVYCVNYISKISDRNFTSKSFSGYLNRKEIVLLQEMLCSEYVYIDRGSFFQKIEILPGSFELLNETEEYNSISFEYKY